ncbi:MAG: bifunctional adenosylcobinamide kinase/adenosylcobinamide-phosphate guanylyltransferase, partial [Pseudomonadota bacterium]
RSWRRRRFKLEREASGDEHDAIRNRGHLVDCLTLWLSNTMLAERDVDAACAELISALSEGDGDIACVSNEVGLSIVPDNPLGRRFRDAQGRLNQQVAAVADRVVFVAAGLPLQLKPAPAP